MKKFLLPVLLYLLCAGNTDCAYFSQTTVPHVDAEQPRVVTTVWNNGQHSKLTANPNPLQLWWHPGNGDLIVHAGLDQGGVREIRTWHRYETTCCDPTLGCLTAVERLPDAVAGQGGGIDSAVSNGLYTFEVLRQPTCPAPRTLRSAGYFWQTQAADFHGHVTVGAQNVAMMFAFEN
jgi:hypothetical protein